MLDFGANPVQRQLILSAQFLHNELPVRLAHRVAELENLPYGLSAKPHVLKVRPRTARSLHPFRRIAPRCSEVGEIFAQFGAPLKVLLHTKSSDSQGPPF